MKPTVVRFVHQTSDFSQKFTIAYKRSETRIFFAYALCNKTDRYEKSVGRSLSAARLNVFLLKLETDLTFANDEVVIDNEYCYGSISISLVKRYVDTCQISMLSNQCIDKLTMMDFKHSFLTKILASVLRTALWD